MAEVRYEGLDAAALTARLGVPDLELHASIGSTNDRAHQRAAVGAPEMSVVLADAQWLGRGRQGRTWASAAGAGVWTSIVLRPSSVQAVQVLALRVGLALADALASHSRQPLRLKWPNDLHTADGKLAGILIEARWQDQSPQWVVVGIGINAVAPPGFGAAALPGISRLVLLDAAVSAVRQASVGEGHLTPDELDAWAHRDLARGREISSPGPGTVLGIAVDGGLQVQQQDIVATFHAGSLLFA